MVMIYGIVYLGNILLTWATLQQPYMSKTLSAPPPQNKNDWVHSVIFEPQPKMLLTRSTYKITSFLDFQPFLQGFQTVDTFIKDLMVDIANPAYFEKLVEPFHNTPFIIGTNQTIIAKFLMSPGCVLHPYACRSKLHFDQFNVEIQYIYKVFRATYKKFLTIIDHMDYHPSQQYSQNKTRIKRSEFYTTYGHYHSPTRELTPFENKFLDAFLKALYKINPTLHTNISRMKRTGIFTWLLGWGIFTNARSISKIKDNLHILQKQNQLQDKQIKQLAKYLNLTMHQVDRHSQMLYEMDTKLLILNKTLQHLMWSIDVIRYENSVLHYFQARIYRVYTSLYALHGDVDSLFEYMRILATQELNPTIIPPDVLKTILHNIENDIKSNARLKLCEDPNTNIWSYYGTIKLTPIVLQDYLMLILTVPLVDQTLYMDLYKVHNLPMLHPTLQMHVQYEIEGPYLATLMDSMYITLPTDIDIRLCLMTRGHLCMFNQALYPVDNTNWCIYALFINDINKIKRNCILKPLNRTTNLAYSLDGYLWAISALAAEKLQIRCVMETHVITIHPPLQIVDIGDGCEAYSTSIYIPAKSELTATVQSLTRSQFFLDYNFQYTNVSNFVVWYKTNFATLTKEEIATLQAKIMKLPTMPMDIFDKTLETINENYPFSLSPKLILALLILIGVCFIIFGILFIWYKRKTTLATSTVGHLHKLIPSLKEKQPTLSSLLPIFSEFVHPNVSTKPETTNAASPQSPTRDKHSKPEMMPRHHTKPNKSKMVTPSAPSIETEPISLELFNRAATDLDAKGEIQLRRYNKFLHQKNKNGDGY